MDRSNNHHAKQRHPSDCAQLRDLVPAYALGLTDPDENRLIERLLEQCPEVAQELADYAALAEALLHSVAPVEPPPDLVDRLLAAAQSDDSTTEEPNPPDIPHDDEDSATTA